MSPSWRDVKVSRFFEKQTTFCLLEYNPLSLSTREKTSPTYRFMDDASTSTLEPAKGIVSKKTEKIFKTHFQNLGIYRILFLQVMFLGERREKGMEGGEKRRKLLFSLKQPGW